jgi:hypothetical protein
VLGALTTSSGKRVVTISSQPLYPAEKEAECDAEKTDNIPHSSHYGKHAVAQLVQALRYKPEGRGFDSRWCH